MKTWTAMLMASCLLSAVPGTSNGFMTRPRHARRAARIALVIPCFNEAARLDRPAFNRFLAQSDPRIELLLVNDGSADGTLELLHQIAAEFPGRVHVIDQQPNRGKAEAVRAGMLQALAGGVEYAGYFDADLATPLEAIHEFVDVLEHNPNVDLVLGARVALLGRRIKRKAHRHYLGRVFATAASVVLALPVYDTQCGAKLLRATPDCSALFATPFGSRWIFDVELIARYLSATRNPDGIYEHPLKQWIDVEGSRVRPRDFVRAIGELANIYRSYFRSSNRMLDLCTAPLLRYIGVGGLGTIFHYVLLAALVELAAVRPPVASVAGAILGAAVNYALNYHFTFTSVRSHRHTGPRFIIVALLAATLQGAGMWVLAPRIHYLVAQAICTLVVLAIGFVLNRGWTFRSGRNAAGARQSSDPSTALRGGNSRGQMNAKHDVVRGAAAHCGVPGHKLRPR